MGGNPNVKTACVIFLMMCVPFRLTAEGYDWLILRSGDGLQGTLLSLQGSRVRFQPRWSESVTVLPAGEVEAVFFGDSGEPAVRENPTHRVTFLDGDRLTGRVIARKDATLTLRVDGEVTLELFSSGIHSLETLAAGDGLLVEDPMAIDRWQGQDPRGMPVQGLQLQMLRGAPGIPLNPPPARRAPAPRDEAVHPLVLGGSWVFAAGQWLSLYRELPALPERFRLAYSIRSPGGAYVVNVGAFTRQPLQRGTGGMFFVHQGPYVQTQGFPEKDGPDADRARMVNWREQVDVPEGQWQQIEVFVDRSRDLAWMRVNGNEVHVWEMRFASEIPAGRWLSFQTQHPPAGLQIAGIELSRWDGTFPGRQVERFADSGDVPAVRSRRMLEAEIRFRAHPDMLTLRVREITADRVVAEGEGFAGLVILPRSRLAGLRFPWMSGGTGALPGLSIDLDTPVLQLQSLPGGGRR
jgi:hypothetical protein